MYDLGNNALFERQSRFDTDSTSNDTSAGNALRTHEEGLDVDEWSIVYRLCIKPDSSPFLWLGAARTNAAWLMLSSQDDCFENSSSIVVRDTEELQPSEVD